MTKHLLKTMIGLLTFFGGLVKAKLQIACTLKDK